VTQPDAAIGCDAGSSARYRWVLHGGALRLTALDDPCAGRAVLLGTEFEPALPYPDTGSVLAEAGRAYVVPDFGVPFRMLTPTGSVTYVEVHREDEIWFTGAAPGNDPSESVSIGVIDGAPANACERHGEKQAIDPGMAGAIAHLESLADQGLRAASRTEATVGGLPAARFEIDATRVPTTCASGVAPWMVGGYPLFVQDGSVITLVEPVPGTVVVIAVRPPDAASAPSPWAESLVGSIEFQPTP